MLSFSLQERLSDVLNGLLEDIKEKLLGPERKLQPVPVKHDN